MKAFLSTCLVLALIFPEVASVICSDPYDDSDFQSCETENGVCFQHFFMGYLNGSRVKLNFKKGCATNCPSTNYSFTISEGFVQSAITCCQYDFCNDERIDYDPHFYNGLTCPFYDASDANDCPKLKSIRCSGYETQCIEFTLVQNDSSVPKKVYNGCATPSFCKLAKTRPYSSHLEGTINKARCGETVPP